MRSPLPLVVLLSALTLTSGGCGKQTTIQVSTEDQTPPPEPQQSAMFTPASRSSETSGHDQGPVLIKERVVREGDTGEPWDESFFILSPAGFDREMAGHSYPLRYVNLIQATDQTVTEYSERDGNGYYRILIFRILGQPAPHYFQAVARRFDPYSHPL